MHFRFAEKIKRHMIEFENPARLALSTAAHSCEPQPFGEILLDRLPEIPAPHLASGLLTSPLEKVMRLAQRLFDVPGASIVLSHAGKMWQQSSFLFETEEASACKLEADVLALEESRSAVRQVQQPDVCNLEAPVLVGGLPAVFYAGVPLLGKDGYRFGTFCLFSSERRKFDDHEVSILTDLAAVATANLELQLSSLRTAQDNAAYLHILSAAGIRQESDPELHTKTGASVRNNDERYQSLIGLLSDWHWEQDEQGRFVLIAEAGQSRTPERFRQYIGKTFFEIPAIHIPDRERRRFNHMTGRQQPFQEIVFQWQDTKEQQRYLSISGQPIFSSKGGFRGYRGITKDVTDKIRFQEELARSNAALRELSEAQQAFRESERKRIARELHDELAQLLATSRMELCLLQRDLKPASSSHQRLDTVDRMIGSSIVSLRKLATDLRPSSLDEGELYYALRSMLKTVSENAGIECDLIASETDLVMDETRSTAIFRLIEECITNIGRHANARKAVVQIHRCGKAMAIRVQDDGRGIRQEEIQQMKALGLTEMRERVLKMNGRLAIKGLPGKGTRIAVTLPHFF